MVASIPSQPRVRMNPPIFWSWARRPHWLKRISQSESPEPTRGRTRSCKKRSRWLRVARGNRWRTRGAFAQRSAENHDGVAEPTEEEMPALVDNQIDVIEDEKSGTVSEGIEKEKSVEAEPADSGTAGDGLPVAEFFFEKGHWGKRSKRHAGGKVLARFSQKEFSNRILVS